jgi:hypothetical protein
MQSTSASSANCLDSSCSCLCELAEPCDATQMGECTLSANRLHLRYLETKAWAAHMLQTYTGTGKVFMAGNWEGDWILAGESGCMTPKWNKSCPLDPIVVQNMVSVYILSTSWSVCSSVGKAEDRVAGVPPAHKGPSHTSILSPLKMLKCAFIWF